MEALPAEIPAETLSPLAGLRFKSLHAYARYLLEQRLEDFARHQMALVRELKLPLLRYLANLDEAQFLNLAIQSAREFLTALAENRGTEFIDESLQRWKANTMDAVTRDQIMVSDITLICYARKQGLVEFIEAYTKDMAVWRTVILEVDAFTLELETRSLNHITAVQQDLYNQAQKLTGIGNYAWDLSRNTISWSEQMYRIYEWNPGEPVSVDRVRAATHPDDLETVRTQMDKLRSTHEPMDYHFRILTGDGRQKVLHAKGTLQKDTADMPTTVIGTVRDVTAQVESEEELRLYNRHLKESEQRVHAILENAPDAVIVMDANGLVEKWNIKAEQTFGWKESEVLGQPLHRFIIPERYRTAHVEGLKRYLSTGQGKVLNNTIEINALRRDGHEIDVSLSIAPTVVRDRQLFTGFVRDITERKRTERQLAESEEQFRLLVSGVKDYAIFILKPDGTIATWNAGAQRNKQYTAQEIIGKHFSIFYTEEDKKRNHPQNELEIAKTQGKYEEEGWRVRKDGSMFWANVLITAIRDDSGKLLGFSKVTRDMTERMLASHRLEDAVHELERSNKELSTFSYAASHDLQEPLRKIQTFSERILEKDGAALSDASRDMFKRMTATAARMKQLIEDLLSYSQVDSAAKDFVLVDLNEVLDDIVQSHKNISEETTISFDVQPLPTVKANCVQMRQLFDNLISNSIKYAKAGTPSFIRITAEATNPPHRHPLRSQNTNWFKISVTDNGIGFDQGYAKRIFEMFQRLHTKSEFAGTGIGLAICKKIVENHGGFIEANSTPGEGATFSVYLLA